jgi:hypothetical protein
MARITEYITPNFDLNPSDRGSGSWSSTARRLNAYYGEVAQSQRAQGTLAAQAEKLKLWPFDILNLYNAQARGSAAAGGGGLSAARRSSGEGFGGPTQSFADFGEAATSYGPGFQGVGQVSRGAAALGGLLSDGGYTAGSMAGSNSARGHDLDAWGNPLSPYQQKARDLQRYKFNEMNEALAYAQKITNMFPEGPRTELYKGELVNAADLDRYEAKERVAEMERQRQYYDRTIDVQSYWRRYYGEGNPGGGYDPNTNYPTGGTNGPIAPPIPATYDDRNFAGFRDWVSGAWNRTDFPEAISSGILQGPLWPLDYSQGIGAGAQGIGP